MVIKKYFAQFKNILITAIMSFFVVICGTLLMRYLSPNTLVQSITESSSISPAPVAPTINSVVAKVAPSIKKQASVHSQVVYKHLPYRQAEPNRMMIVASYATGKYQRFEFLDPEAGKALIKLIYTARDEGVWIIPVSGFRTIEQQQKLFQDQIKRRGSVEAAKVSAPAGYSEHHTGFAVDLADGRFPKQDVTYKSENTDAYRWLTVHAKEFGFEMSFTPNNAQGVSFEPWHWRYIGSPRAAAAFTTARRLS